jgi:hypothetical protein
MLGLPVMLTFIYWGDSIWLTFTYVICIIPIAITYLYYPKRYLMDSDNLCVVRPIGKIRINRDDILLIEKLSPEDLKGIYRKAASGGLFGYIGLFNTGKHGDIHVYTGSLKDHLVFVKLKSGKQYLFSPKNVQEFYESIIR